MSKEKETHERRQRLAMSPEEIAMSREKATDGMRTFRQAMSPEEIAMLRQKATDGMRTFRQAMSPEEIAKSRNEDIQTGHVTRRYSHAKGKGNT
jgi:hypothetical protein